jgi:hypothetical protein
MKKRTALKVLMIAGLAAVAVFAFTGCEALNLKMEVEGTWVNESTDEKFVISNGVYSYYWPASADEPSYTFTIVEFDNGGFNGGETGAGDCGYAVLQFKDAPDYNPDASGFTVLRWQNLKVEGEETQIEISEGVKDPDGFGGEPPIYEDSAEDAAENVTEANGWFAFGYSGGYVLQAE